MITNEKKKKAAVVILLILIASAAFLLYQKEEKEREEQGILTIYGNVDIRQIQLAFFNEGRIKTMLVDEGQVVNAGQLVAEIDPVRLEAEVKRLESEVETQQQIVNRLHAGSRPQEIKEAAAEVRAAEAALKDARITFQRIKKLAKTQYVSRQRLDDAQARLDQAAASLDAARQRYDLAVIGPRKEDIAAGEARLKSLQAALSHAREKLKDSRLYAPASGIIRDRILEPGDMAFPEKPVYTLALTNPLWVRAFVPEPELGKIQLGMEAEVKTDSFPDTTFRGWVGYISPTAEFTPRNVETPDLRTRLVYQVRIYVCNHDNKMRLGMPATVKILLNRKPKAGDLSPSSICREK